MKARRYQLRKEAVSIAVRGHPWIFREQLSSAASIFGDGDWLRLVDGQNRVIGHGIYESEGAIAIRMLRTGPDRPDAAWLRATLRAALAKRAELAKTTDGPSSTATIETTSATDGIRLLHGESDGVPAVVVDRFGDTIVVASYSSGADAIARYIARALVGESTGEHRAVVGPATNVLLRPARRRRGPALPSRALRGSPPDIAHFTEGGLHFAVDLAGGHKTGTYLDLRGLRRALATSRSSPTASQSTTAAASPALLDLRGVRGARVLNTFAYTGMLGRAAEAGGAAHITHVDQSERALAFARAHHVADPTKHAFITADVFEWLPALSTDEQFDVVICDPPSMTSKKTQVPGVLAAYRKLYKAAERHVRPGGLLVSACCTSRVERADFTRTVRQALPDRFTLERDIPPEPDHPVGFPQADYLKILLWRARA